PFEDNVTSWMVVSEDQSEAIVGRYQVLGKPHPGYSRLLLEGLNPDFEYQIEGITGTFYGDELMYAGLHLEKVNGDFTSQVFKRSEERRVGKESRSGAMRNGEQKYVQSNG